MRLHTLIIDIAPLINLCEAAKFHMYKCSIVGVILDQNVIGLGQYTCHNYVNYHSIQGAICDYDIHECICVYVAIVRCSIYSWNSFSALCRLALSVGVSSTI